MSDTLQALVDMSHYLGDPNLPYAILGEGNTSARIDSDHFYIKASGTTLGTMGPKDFLPVSISKVTAILDDPGAGDQDVSRVLKESLLDPEETRMPSVETMMHALLYQYPEFNFIGHTHPIATNAILCSNRARDFAEMRFCPDQIVVMGHKCVFIPYVDPGLVLARQVREQVRRFIETEGVMPRAILLENHGCFALADTPKKVIGITQMTEKCAKILLGACAAGEPKFLSEQDVQRIDTRPDELYRRKII
jgi:rhamnose utilization protein RhaD (predicted bifunctional aldolase and dehydrogenase)